MAGVTGGLTEAEARGRLAARRDNDSGSRPLRTFEMARRESVFNIFHLNLAGLILIQVLLGEWIGALVTFAIFCLNTALRMGQQVLSQKRIMEVRFRTRPKSTVVRDGKARSIDSSLLVPGDLLVVGPGDQIQADGRIASGALVIDTSVVTGRRGWARVQEGDEVFAGSSCISGRATCVAEKVGQDRLIHARLTERIRLASRPTPLERLIARILFALFAVVTIYAALLLAKFFRLDVGDSLDSLIDAAPVIFGLAPTGLYLMIIVTYATGTADLVRKGALVLSARSVESLAESTVLCFTEVGLLAGTAMEVLPLGATDDEDADRPSTSQLRQILGDFARSTTVPGVLSRLLARSFEGEERALRAESYNLAAEGWSALGFDDDGDTVYVLAEPRVLEAQLAASGVDAVDLGGPGPLSTGEEAMVADTLVLARGHGELTDADGLPRLPDGLVPLCAVQYRRRVRPEAISTIRGFLDAGVQIKVFAAEDPAEVVAVLREAGLTAEDEAQLTSSGGISGAELEALPRSRWVRASLEHRLFGGLTPQQVGDLVGLLRDNGQHVTVVGDGVADLPALQEAHLAVAQPASTQSALDLADIVLLENAPTALLRVLHRGQAIVRGLLDVIQLNLAMVLCSALLIVDVRLVGIGFPYVAAQGTVITVFCVTIPSIALPFLASHGAVSSRLYWPILLRFVLPAGVSLSLMAFGVYLFFLGRTGSVATAQLAVTYTLAYSALVLGVLLKPPLLSRPVPGGGTPRREWRMLGLASVLAVVVTLLPFIPLARRQFRIDLLPQLWEYPAVFLAVAVWVGVLQLVWRWRPRIDPAGDRAPVADTAPEPD